MLNMEDGLYGAQGSLRLSPNKFPEAMTPDSMRADNTGGPLGSLGKVFCTLLFSLLFSFTFAGRVFKEELTSPDTTLVYLVGIRRSRYIAPDVSRCKWCGAGQLNALILQKC